MAGLPSIYIFIFVFLSCLFVEIYCDGCPHSSNNPSKVNERVDALKNQALYTIKDTDYSYELRICQVHGIMVAVRQTDLKTKKSYTAGTYAKAIIRGGTDWIMISYGGGEHYHTHCNQAERRSDLIIICDPNESRGTLKIIEEFRTNNTGGDKNDVYCYYLFELNNKAACTPGPPKTISPGSILLIIFLILVSVYLVLGFLYQRFVAGAKGIEQIPNYNMWRAFGNLQADGCNFICRCAEVRRPPRYKPVEDALSDDTTIPDDDKLLPM